MATVLVDLDDTLADTMTALLAYVNARAARRYRHGELTREFREGETGEFRDLVKTALRTGEGLEAIAPLADSLSGMERLAKAGYEVHVASARKENLHAHTEDWLQQHGYHPHIARIHRRSSDQPGTEFKRAVAERIGATAAFDDTYAVAEVLAPVCPVYLVDAPWNREPGLPETVIRVPSFTAGVERFLE